MLRYNYLLGDIVNIQKKYKIDYIGLEIYGLSKKDMFKNFKKQWELLMENLLKQGHKS